MSLTTNFERGFLFRLTRGFALLIVVTLLLFGVTAAIGIYAQWPSEEPARASTKEVIERLAEDRLNRTSDAPDRSNAAVKDDPLSGVVIPEGLMAEMAAAGTPQPADAIWSDEETRERNREIVGNWVAGMTPDEKQDFVSAMGEAAFAAGLSGFDPLAAINTFHTLSVARAAKAEAARAKREELRNWSVGGTGALLLLIALFSLVLVLLAIERNTRNAEVA